MNHFHGSTPPQDGPGGAAFQFDAALAGKRAECDGGRLTEVGITSRDEFAGTLTGVFFEQGEPPSRWYLMTVLDGRPGESAWCERGFLFLEGAQR